MFQLYSVYFAMTFLIVSFICSIFMLISISKQGDERKKYILSKSCTQSFLVYTTILFIDVIYTIFFEKYSNFVMENTPIVSLGLISIIFTVSIFINKRKYGN
ncbi:hypothetical protein [Paraclostridium sordellii]|uniref:hypothetical protein n=1 Tax=Paraclostridium sordellii TaxID=1505 RepID=UPI001FA73AF3|nr:hypothetical protein [Paeniclostridium sordellii]